MCPLVTYSNYLEILSIVTFLVSQARGMFVFKAVFYWESFVKENFHNMSIVTLFVRKRPQI